MWNCLLFVCFFFASCTAYNFVCKSGWSYQHNDYCYKKFSGMSVNWYTARGICRGHGGFLVGVRDRSKQNHIQGLARSGHLWTGGNDLSRKRHWVWDEGDRISFSNWDSHEPSNSNGNEDCIELRSEHSWTWNDESCSSERPFMCELHACHLPEHCISTTCTTTDDYQCAKCQDEKSTPEYSIYWPTSNKKVCKGI
ncbi:perlucin-like [Saccostrea cucullata]|uniref:perlucin-like n=1 Tax=Saccostrea cuccullata TaxID=36930 RepID=UPI002ED2C054